MSWTHPYLLVGMMVAGVPGPGAVEALKAQQSQTPPQVTTQVETVPAQTIQEFAGDEAHAKTVGITLPVLVGQTSPKYTPATMRAGVEGLVLIWALVGIDGSIERSQVAKSLHPDLDAEALRTLAQWQFKPGRLRDAPVRVAVEVQMEFRLRRD